MESSRTTIAALVLCGIALGCQRGPRLAPSSSGAADAGRSEAALDPAALARLPAAPQLEHTRVTIPAGDPRDAEALADVERCASCHAGAHAAWSESAHARASFDNPWYGQASAAFRAERGHAAGSFCSGCHEPALLVAGRAGEAPNPEDPLTTRGITCGVCHGIERVDTGGAASYTLRTERLFIPDLGDPASIARHRAAVTPEPLRTGQLCGSCHRGFLEPEQGPDHFLSGVDDLGPWRSSVYGGSEATRLDARLPPQSCQSCHMPRRPIPRGAPGDLAGAELADHHFAGGHQGLAALSDDAREAADAALRDAVRLSVHARREEGVLELATVVTNVGVGHHFPGGLRDASDVWIELTLRDASGDVLASAGRAWTRGEADPGAYRLRAWSVDDEGALEDRHHVHRFSASVADTTLAPRASRVVLYRLDENARASFALRAEARLLMRTHPPALREAACAHDPGFESERGALDPCARTIVELARVDEPLAYYTANDFTPNSFRDTYDLARAFAAGTQERLDRSEALLDRLDAIANTRFEHAQAAALRARIYARQGREAEALAALAPAEAIVGEHPALARIRGRAHAQVWHWERAKEAFSLAARLAPGDRRAHVDLAIAALSAGAPLEALQATHDGLALQPRDPDQLRVQYLALEELAVDDAGRALGQRAREAWRAHRRPDRLDTLRHACAARDPACRIALDPAPTITLP